MAQYSAVSVTGCAKKSWHKTKSYRPFAAERTAPLVGLEFPKAAVTFPIAWVVNNDQFEPVGLLGLVDSENLFVDAHGRWVGAYCPAHFRTQPFRLMPAHDNTLTLAVRDDLGLVTDDDTGYPFFTDDGDLSPELQEVVARLQQTETNRAATQRASNALAEAGLLTPWPISAAVHGQAKTLTGLYHVSEPALDALDAATLHHLRDTGGLAMAYCQQISRQLVQRLELLHERRAREKVKRSTHPADASGFGLGVEDSATGISFGGMTDRLE